MIDFMIGMFGEVGTYIIVLTALVVALRILYRLKKNEEL